MRVLTARYGRLVRATLEPQLCPVPCGRCGAALEPAGDSRDVAIALRVGFAPRAPSEFLTYDFRYHAASLTTEVRPVRDAERHLG